MGVLKRLALIFTAIFSFGAITLASGSLAYAQTADELIQQGLCAGADLKLTDGNCQATGDDGVERVNRAIRKLINTLSLIVGIVAVVMIIIGGLRYVTSGGSDTNVTSAKNTILYAIIGLIIVALAQIMVRFVLRQLTG